MLNLILRIFNIACQEVGKSWYNRIGLGLGVVGLERDVCIAFQLILSVFCIHYSSDKNCS